MRGEGREDTRAAWGRGQIFYLAHVHVHNAHKLQELLLGVAVLVDDLHGARGDGRGVRARSAGAAGLRGGRWREARTFICLKMVDLPDSPAPSRSSLIFCVSVAKSWAFCLSSSFDRSKAAFCSGVCDDPHAPMRVGRKARAPAGTGQQGTDSSPPEQNSERAGLSQRDGQIRSVRDSRWRRRRLP